MKILLILLLLTGCATKRYPIVIVEEIAQINTEEKWQTVIYDIT